MIEPLNLSDLADQMDLPDGRKIVLLDRLGKGDQFSKGELARNVFCVDSDGRVKWRVRSQFDDEGSPFTRLHFEGKQLSAYRWDGGSYAIDSDTGLATPIILER